VAYPPEQVNELRTYCQKVSALPEGGVTYILLENLRLPPGCTPSVCDALLCPEPRDGYSSRLFFSQQIASSYSRNWNKSERIGERSWVAFSWKPDPAKKTLPELLVAHLTGLVTNK
jgi:hypothetical protein